MYLGSVIYLAPFGKETKEDADFSHDLQLQILEVSESILTYYV